MGSWSLKAPLGGILHSSPVLPTCQLKNDIILHGLFVYHWLYFCIPSFNWDVEPEKSWRCNSCFLAGQRRRERERDHNPSTFKSFVSLLPCRMSLDKFYAALFLTGEPLQRAERNWFILLGRTGTIYYASVC